jgi:ubiquinone/menaquinone biosynthesis C-methylase UbiE
MPTDTEILRRTYDRAATTYDLWAKTFETRVKAHCVALARVAAPRTALDVGVGTGDLSAALVRALPALELHGIDVSPAMLERARRKLPPSHAARLVEGDARDMPYADATFDLVVCTYVLELVDDYLPLLDEIARVAKPTATLIFAGVVERPELRYRLARIACRRHPSWCGGLDGARLTAWFAKKQAAVTDAFVSERGMPARVIAGTLGA